MPNDEWKVAFKKAFAEAEEAELVATEQLAAAQVVQARAHQRRAAAATAKAAAERELARLEALKSNPKKAKKDQGTIITDSSGVIQTADLELAGAVQEISTAEQRVAQAQKDRQDAINTARGEHSRVLRALAPSLAELGRIADDPPVSLIYAQMATAHKADDFDIDALYDLTQQAEEAILKLLGPKNVAATLKACQDRMDVLAAGVFAQAVELTPIRKELKRITTSLTPEILGGVDPAGARGQALVDLTRAVAPRLDEFEGKNVEYTTLSDGLVPRLATLATSAFRNDERLAALNKQLKAALTAARTTGLAQGISLLEALADAVADEEAWTAQNEQDAAAYPGELAAVTQEANSFDTDNPGLKLACKNKLRLVALAASRLVAEGDVGTRDYTTARDYLSEARSVQVGLRAWAAALKAGLDQKAQEAAAAAAQAAAAKAAAAAAALALQQAQTAINSASLAAIGKNKFTHWMSHLGALLHAPVPPVRIQLGFQGGLKQFPGVVYTAEVECEIVDVTSGAKVGEFVVHYHPRLPKSADSRLHAKAGRSIPPKFPMSESSHWLMSHGGVPAFNHFS